MLPVSLAKPTPTAQTQALASMLYMGRQAGTTRVSQTTLDPFKVSPEAHTYPINNRSPLDPCDTPTSHKIRSYRLCGGP